MIEEIPGEAEEEHVRYTSAKPSSELTDAWFGWQTLESSGHFAWRGRADRFVDPAALVPITWPRRTTLAHTEEMNQQHHGRAHMQTSTLNTMNVRVRRTELYFAHVRPLKPTPQSTELLCETQ